MYSLRRIYFGVLITWPILKLIYTDIFILEKDRLDKKLFTCLKVSQDRPSIQNMSALIYMFHFSAYKVIVIIEYQQQYK